MWVFKCQYHPIIYFFLLFLEHLVWKNFCGRKNGNLLGTPRICSDHFLTSEIIVRNQKINREMEHVFSFLYHWIEKYILKLWIYNKICSSIYTRIWFLIVFDTKLTFRNIQSKLMSLFGWSIFGDSFGSIVAFIKFIYLL